MNKKHVQTGSCLKTEHELEAYRTTVKADLMKIATLNMSVAHTQIEILVNFNRECIILGVTLNITAQIHISYSNLVIDSLAEATVKDVIQNMPCHLRLQTHQTSLCYKK